MPRSSKEERTIARPMAVTASKVEISSGNKHYFGQTAITFKKR
jgi:hypothetical protein